MVIFHSYVSLPEGKKSTYVVRPKNWGIPFLQLAKFFCIYDPTVGLQRLVDVLYNNDHTRFILELKPLTQQQETPRWETIGNHGIDHKITQK